MLGQVSFSPVRPMTTVTHDLGCCGNQLHFSVERACVRINGEMVIDNWPFIWITLIAVTATIGVLWIFSTKQAKKLG
jgi:hypothetical protein